MPAHPSYVLLDCPPSTASTVSVTRCTHLPPAGQGPCYCPPPPTSHVGCPCLSQPSRLTIHQPPSEMVAPMSTMDAFNLPATLILPAVILLSYDLAAHSSVRTFAAVSQLADAPAPQNDQDRKALKRKLVKRALAIVILCGLVFSTEAYVILSDNEQVLSAFFGVLAGSILVSRHRSEWPDSANVMQVLVHLIRPRPTSDSGPRSLACRPWSDDSRPEVSRPQRSATRPR